MCRREEKWLIYGQINATFVSFMYCAVPNHRLAEFDCGDFNPFASGGAWGGVRGGKCPLHIVQFAHAPGCNKKRSSMFSVLGKHVCDSLKTGIFHVNYESSSCHWFQFLKEAVMIGTISKYNVTKSGKWLQGNKFRPFAPAYK